MSNSSSNISVVCRVRPLFSFESVIFTQSDLNNQEVISCLSENSIGFGQSPPFEIFNFDQVFSPSSTQTEVYEYLGKTIIDDVLAGYNGTIFAYGQTGSGKTHTMLGDVLNEEEHGVIPRVATQIFEMIEKDEQEIEFTLKCSLLEIYKETLRDLLEIDVAGLQIKECPRRGIYVKGLTEVCVTSEQELIELLCLGQQLRTVAATKLNSTSSRSHFIFILEVLQKLPNDSEKKGILNLVDLAGSEKVSHSGVTGNNLEEAKKINLSLSALGKVIQSLIYNHDHIPYRDSKLTRLLQESLGGNFKTTLLVTCSPAARSQTETLDSLKFAVRAKAIKNKARINLKTPPDSYIKIIELLKKELSHAKNEIKQLRTQKTEGSLGRFEKFQAKMVSKSQTLSKSKLSVAAKPPTIPLTRRGSASVDLNMTSVSKRSLPLITIDSDTSFLPTQEKINDESIMMSFQSSNQHEIELEKMQETIISLRSDKEFLSSTIKELQEKLNSCKIKQLKLEQKAHEYHHAYLSTANILDRDSIENSLLKVKNEGLQKQLQKLINKIEEIEKKHRVEFEEFKNFKENTVLEFNEDPEHANYRSDIPVISQQADDTQTISFSSFSLSCDPKLTNTSYSNILKKAIEDPGYFNKDFAVYLLQQQLLQAAVANSELSSNISSLNWKLSLVKHKYKVKRELCIYQHEHIGKLEGIVDHLHDSYSRIVNLTEKIEFRPRESLSKQRTRTVKSVTHKQAFTTRGFHKQFTENNRIQIILDETSIALRVSELESNLNLQKLFNTQLKRNNDIYKSHNQKTLEMLNEFERSAYVAEKAERERWKKIFKELQKNAEKELVRKQQEIIELNDILGAWVNSFMALQESLNVKLIEKSDFGNLQDLIRKTSVMLEGVSTGCVYFSSSPIIPSKPCSPFMKSFKGDVPI